MSVGLLERTLGCQVLRRALPMKSWSCVILGIVATVQLGYVSSFVALAPAPSDALRSPLAARCPPHAQYLCSSHGSKRANTWVQSLSAEVRYASHSKEPTRSISLWHHLADLVRAVVVQTAVLASFFVLSPVIAQANSGRPTSTATVEAQAPSARSLQPKRVVRLATVLPMDALGDARVSNAAAQKMARTSSDVPSKLEDLSLLEQAEGLSTERKNWLYSQQARKMGVLLVSAASFTVDSNMVDSALVAKAQEPAQQQEPLENAEAAISHATNAGLHTRTHTHAHTFLHACKLRQSYDRERESEQAKESARARKREREIHTHTHANTPHTHTHE